MTVLPENPSTAAGDKPEGRDAWDWSIPGWHLGFGLLFVMLLAIGALNGSLSTGQRVAYEALGTLIGLTYLFIGAPALTTRQAWRRHTYRIVLVLALGAMVAIDSNASYFLFIAFPQLWVLGDGVWGGIAYSIALGGTVGLGFLTQQAWTADAVRSVAGSMAIGVCVSLAMGIWITRVVEQSQGRAALIEELRAARGELAEANHAAGVIAERERMAGEIHDTLAQGFTSVVMHAQAAQVELARGRDSDVTARLASIEDTARDNLDEARALVAAFAPAALADSTLAEALRRLADRFQAETGVTVGLTLEPSETTIAALHPGRQVVLLRAAQEGLTNVRKHANATQVTVRIVVDCVEDTASIEVVDDGIGFDAGAITTVRAGYGLAGMRGRVEQVGGSVQVDSAPGRGTAVHVTMPASAS